MHLAVKTYHFGTSPLHRADPRIKIALLLAYSITLFLLETWTGLAIAAVLYALAHAISRVPFRSVFVLAAPTYVSSPIYLTDAEVSMAAPFAGFDPIAVAGSFGFVPAGFAKGAFNAIRVVILVYASLLVSFTTTSTEMMSAASSFMAPLKRTPIPVDDAACALSIALRFIPVTAEELCQVHDAQWSRCARFSGSGVVETLRAWGRVFVALFVALFRRADRLAAAMDARCYGAPTKDGRRSSLEESHLGIRGVAVIVVGIAACAFLALFF